MRLRAVEVDDAATLNRLFGDPEVLRGLMLTFPQPDAGFREWVRSHSDRPDSAGFVIETLEGEAIGGCGFDDIDPRPRTAVLGVWIGRPYWDQGYGTDAVRTLCRFGFRQMNLQRITLRVYETNPKAIHTYEKIGFKTEGKLRREQFQDGRYIDVLMMGVLAEEFVEG